MRRLFGGMFVEDLTVAVAAGTLPHPGAAPALQLLASSPSGVTAELLVLAHAFSRGMLAGLVLAGLATVVAETLQADGPTIKIERIRITEASRRAIEH